MKNVMHSKVRLILPTIIIMLVSCTDNYIFVRYTIPPPPPDTTLMLTAMHEAGPGIIPADSMHPSMPGAYLSVWPPEPDTTRMVIGNCQKIGKIEVIYYTSSPVKPDNIAYIVDSDNRIIDSTSAVSVDKPVSLIYGSYYPTKAVFQLNKSMKSPVVKITIPNKPAFPDGHEIFYIKFD